MVGVVELAGYEGVFVSKGEERKEEGVEEGGALNSREYAFLQELLGTMLTSEDLSCAVSTFWSQVLCGGMGQWINRLG